MQKQKENKRLILKNDPGFTLIEVLIAIVILSIGLLGMASLSVNIIKGNRLSNDLTAATTLAQQKMEDIRLAAEADFTSVVDDGPDVKEAITKSSNDRVNANNQPEMTAGAIIGNVTLLNASKCVQPKSSAASSSDESKLTSLLETTTET